MSWDWEWASRIERRIAIDELMASLVELVHEIESNLGESPWAIDPIIEAGLLKVDDKVVIMYHPFLPEGELIARAGGASTIPRAFQKNVSWWPTPRITGC